MSADAIAIAVHGLRVERGGTTVLHDLDLEVPAGRITGLLGPSGCGKSTLMRSIVGVQRIRAGTVEVLGKPAGDPQLRVRVGYVTQQPSVYGDLTVTENLRFFARVLGVGLADVDRCIEEVDLEGQRDRIVDRLSGGQRARVSLAVALLGGPGVLVLDEPTVGLDPVLRRDLWNLFLTLATRDEVTLLVSSHVMDEADRCQRLLLMRAGRIIADDEPEELLRRTGTATVEDAFLSLVGQAPPRRFGGEG